MYVPAHFAGADLAEIAAFVDRAGAADLVTFDGSRPISTLLPVIWDRSVGPHGRLIGHLARSNTQWRTAAAGVPALAIVHGPQAYISPAWYQSTREHGRTVPTWNYTTVHLTGPVTFHHDADWLRDVVTRLTERHETGRPGRWWVTDAPEPFIDGQLRAIVGIELLVERIEAKDKLSQNRSAQDRAGVIAALREEPGVGSRAIADLMAAHEELQDGELLGEVVQARARTRRASEYAVLMKKRITLSLDEDIVEALHARGARSLSAAANEALREAIADDAHRAALLAWLDELDAKHGAPTAGQLAAADALLDAVERGEPLPGGEPGQASAA